MGQSCRDEALVQHQRRVGQRLFDVTVGPLHVGFPGGKLALACIGEVLRRPVPGLDDRISVADNSGVAVQPCAVAARIQRRQWIHGERQRFEIVTYSVQRIRCDGFALGGHGQYRLADEERFVRERRLHRGRRRTEF